jgi:hypothetical protein
MAKPKKSSFPNIPRTRSQKILLCLYKLSEGHKQQIRFEDIAIEAFLNFGSDFQLKGYPDYPDTGDIIHKPLYSELKKDGYVLSGNKYFSLTEKGIEYAQKLIGADVNGNKINSDTQDKLSALDQKELERIMDSDAFKLYNEGKADQILDIDFYSYLGVTVRTGKFDFLGRLSTVEEAIRAVSNRNGEIHGKLTMCHEYLMEKFKDSIDYFKNSKGGKRW